jgi:hypothetical protein
MSTDEVLVRNFASKAIRLCIGIDEQVNAGSASSKPGIQTGTRMDSSDGISDASEALICGSSLNRGSFDNCGNTEACVVAATTAIRNVTRTRVKI